MTDIKQDYKRVTEVLSPFSGLQSVPAAILANAAHRGTIIHLYCDAVIEAIDTPEIEPDWQGYIDSFLLWEKGKKFLAKPSRLYCDKLMICGEIDGIYRDGNDIVLFDFKTPLREGKTWYLQLSAYWYLCKENGIKVDRIQAVKLEKDGSDPKIFEYEIKFDEFLDCLKIYEKFFKRKKDDDIALDYL